MKNADLEETAEWCEFWLPGSSTMHIITRAGREKPGSSETVCHYALPVAELTPRSHYGRRQAEAIFRAMLMAGSKPTSSIRWLGNEALAAQK
ncbi:hypothetical protein ACNKHW_16835 [Shigella flexneri]